MPELQIGDIVSHSIECTHHADGCPDHLSGALRITGIVSWGTISKLLAMISVDTGTLEYAYYDCMVLRQKRFIKKSTFKDSPHS